MTLFIFLNSLKGCPRWENLPPKILDPSTPTTWSLERLVYLNFEGPYHEFQWLKNNENLINCRWYGDINGTILKKDVHFFPFKTHSKNFERLYIRKLGGGGDKCMQQ